MRTHCTYMYTRIAHARARTHTHTLAQKACSAHARAPRTCAKSVQRAKTHRARPRAPRARPRAPRAHPARGAKTLLAQKVRRIIYLLKYPHHLCARAHGGGAPRAGLRASRNRDFPVPKHIFLLFSHSHRPLAQKVLRPGGPGIDGRVAGARGSSNGILPRGSKKKGIFWPPEPAGEHPEKTCFLRCAHAKFLQNLDKKV